MKLTFYTKHISSKLSKPGKDLFSIRDQLDSSIGDSKVSSKFEKKFEEAMKAIEEKEKFDFVFSLGVIHHIPNYQKVCSNIFNSLKKNGQFVCWVYGYEGNEIYIFIFDIIITAVF